MLPPGSRQARLAAHLHRWTLICAGAGVLGIVPVLFTARDDWQRPLYFGMLGIRLLSVMLYACLLTVTRQRWLWLSVPLILLPELLPFGLISFSLLGGGLALIHRQRRRAPPADGPPQPADRTAPG